MSKPALAIAIAAVVACSPGSPSRADGPPAEGSSTKAPIRVLFVGNSYTFVNDLPGQFRRLSAAAGLAVEVTSRTAPGATLAAHIDGDRTRVEAGEFTHVVVQDQSLRPMRDPEGHGRDLARIASAVRQQGAKPMLFVTWARRDAPGTQQQIDAASRAAAAAAGAGAIYVGRAWHRARALHRDLILHHPDGSHPSPAGTYLAACVVFRAIHERSPVGLAGLELDEQLATRLQRVAAAE